MFVKPDNFRLIPSRFSIFSTVGNCFMLGIQSTVAGTVLKSFKIVSVNLKP